MCTVVVLIRSDQILLAANRDERLERAWDPPAAWWPDHPGVIAGRDRMAGGTWMGINRHGLVATVLNRPGTLGPAAGKRSRGELPLMALDHSTATAAADALTKLDAGLWRGFNMVLADRAVVGGGGFLDHLLSGGQVGGRVERDVQVRVGQLGVDGGGVGLGRVQGVFGVAAPVR